MQFSFNPSKKSSKLPPKPISRTFGFGGADDGHGEPTPPEPTYLTEFDPSKNPADGKPPISIIPPKPNEWRPFKRMKNLDLPLQQADPTAALDKFESQPKTLDDDSNASSVSYGLTLRKSGDANSNSNSSNGQPGNPRMEPREPRKSAPLEVQRLNEDLEALGDDPGFEDMPVEGYGAALLAGYGWQEGTGIGRNAKEDVKVRQFARGAVKGGLGYEPDKVPPQSEPRKHKPGGNQRRDEGRALMNREAAGVSAGKEVRIIGGSEDGMVGLKGEILEVLDGGELVLRLSRTGKEVRIRAMDVAALGSREEERCLKKLKELRIRNESKSGSRNRRSEEAKRESSDGSGKVRWLTSHIRVRVISKDLKRGRLYRKKGKIVDVVGPMSCDLLMDETGELIQGVDQVLLETALPKRGGPVLVLSGRHKGVHGSLVERDLDQETGIVRDADTHELFNVRLEQIAEFVEDPSLIGY